LEQWNNGQDVFRPRLVHFNPDIAGHICSGI